VKADWSFLRLVAYCVLGSAGLAYYPLSAYASPEVVEGVVAGGIMGVVNLLLGYTSIEIGFGKSNTTFLKIVLGGMVARMLLMWGALVVMLKWYQFHPASLVFALLFTYVLTLVLEISYLQKKVSLKN
jgi:hypothetical protein